MKKTGSDWAVNFIPSRYKNIIGSRFNMLTINSNAFKKGGTTYVNASCDCGNEKTYRPYVFFNEKTCPKSCGCKVTNTRHGMSKTRIYGIYNNIKARCYKESEPSFKRYGARGIKMCKEWLGSFSVFYDWSIKNGYSNKLSIDRIDNDGDYCPDNCRWVDVIVQANNKSDNLLIDDNGETLTAAEFSRKHNMPHRLVRRRFHSNSDSGFLKTNKNQSFKPVYCNEMDLIFETVSSASRAIGCSRTLILRQIKGQSKKAKGYTFKYL